MTDLMTSVKIEPSCLARCIKMYNLKPLIRSSHSNNTEVCELLLYEEENRESQFLEQNVTQLEEPSNHEQMIFCNTLEAFRGLEKSECSAKSDTSSYDFDLYSLNIIVEETGSETESI